METLKAALIAFLRKQSDIAPVEKQIDDFLTANPEKSKHVRALLDKATEVGLSKAVFDRLSDRVERTTRNFFAETVVLPTSPKLSGKPASETAFLETVVLPTSPKITREVAQDTLHGHIGPLHGDGDTTAPTASQHRGEATESSTRDLPTPADDDETVINTKAGIDTQAGVTTPAQTTIRKPPASAEATQAPSLSDDMTTINPNVDSDDLTRAGPEMGKFEDQTVAVANLDKARAPEFDSQQGDASDSSNTDPPLGRAQPDEEFREGSMLRQRFELLSKLGEGGMGAVWKGKDMLKVEARAKDPFVAIKLLQGDFKEHPEAFIALQRETSKQQRLAPSQYRHRLRL